MKGDYSRDTFDPAKHFSRVLMQQGRVQLDADWNEQGAILLHYLQALAADLIGAYGGPKDELGFEIGPVSPENDKTKLTDLSIGYGRYYVDGILCENPEQAANVVRSPRVRTEAAPKNHTEASGSRTAAQSQTTYRHQTDYPPDRPNEDPDKDLATPLVVYLDVWERHISSLEDEDIREVALGGPDTAARAKVVWQVRIKNDFTEDQKRDVEKVNCKNLDTREGQREFKKALQSEDRGLLRARAYVPEESGDVCIVSPESRYRGAENQLYRVEIHEGGNSSGHPTFKWSRENGSTIYPIQSVSDKTVVLESLGRDERFGLEVGDWVEVVDDDYTLLGKADHLLRVDFVDPIEMTLTLHEAPKGHVGHNPKKHPFLRRWDQQQGDPKTGGLTLTDGAAHIIERTKSNSHWLNLEDGVQVQFEPGATYRQGDYWLIPARTATGDVEWPGPPDNPTPMPPNGVEHHYAPLAAVVKGKDTADPFFTVIDLRRQIDPLGKCVCPKIEVIHPTKVRPGNQIAFSARVGSNDPALTYKWKTVQTGPGGVTTDLLPDPPPKRSITINPPTSGVTAITATVEVANLPAGCETKASGTCEIGP